MQICLFKYLSIAYSSYIQKRYVIKNQVFVEIDQKNQINQPFFSNIYFFLLKVRNNWIRHKRYIIKAFFACTHIIAEKGGVCIKYLTYPQEFLRHPKSVMNCIESENL